MPEQRRTSWLCANLLPPPSKPTLSERPNLLIYSNFWFTNSALLSAFRLFLFVFVARSIFERCGCENKAKVSEQLKCLRRAPVDIHLTALLSEWCECLRNQVGQRLGAVNLALDVLTWICRQSLRSWKSLRQSQVFRLKARWWSSGPDNVGGVSCRFILE